MPRIQQPIGTTQKISLSQILETGNVRDNYSDIEELAQSIRENGLMQPIVVKRALIKDGIQQYELVAGHRRKKAFEYLCSKGEDFTLIDAIVKTGDKLSLQLIENIQRKDLTAEERETGIAKLADTGITQKEIAHKLAKSEQWVSKQLASHKIRQVLIEENIDTSMIETSVLNVFRTAKEKDLPTLFNDLKIKGINRTNAEILMQEYKNEIINPKTTFLFPNAKKVAESLITEEQKQAPIISKPATNKAPVQETHKAKPHNITSYKEEIEAEDKKLSARTVYTEINAYIKAVEDNIEKAEKPEIEKAKIEAAYDIIALLHERT